MSDLDTAQQGAEVVPAIPETEQESSQPTGEQIDTPQEEKPRDDKGRFVPQERVNEITRARREAERRNEALERELSLYRNQQQTQQHQPAQPSSYSHTSAPTLEDFDYDMGKWSNAVAQHAAMQAASVAEQRFHQQDVYRQQQTVVQQFNERSQKFAAEHPDFDDAMAELSHNVQFRPEVVEAIGLSEYGPAVVHYLAKHLDEADRISRLPPHLAAMSIGRIEGQVSAPRPKPVSNAPAPMPTLGGGGVLQKDPERMSTDEWLAWRRASLKK